MFALATVESAGKPVACFEAKQNARTSGMISDLCEQLGTLPVEIGEPT